MEVWGPARARAGEERDQLQKAVQAEGGNFELAAWDWRYYAEKVRKAKFDVDDGEIKPYLQLDSVIAAAFDVAGKLFGVTFTERTDLPVYHPDVRAFEVKRDGAPRRPVPRRLLRRPSKHSGAWMSGWRKQEKLAGDITPIVVNVMNFAKGAPGEPTLLSLDDARTLFHEFGHGLHGLLSNVTYPTVSGTSVEKDFVELPSQLYEHWLTRPEVLTPLRPPLQDAASRCRAALLEAAAGGAQLQPGLQDGGVPGRGHRRSRPARAGDGQGPRRRPLREGDAGAHRHAARRSCMRHRIPHFQHIIGGYAAGYYSYLWSEVMDADAFHAFEEAGDVFDAKLAKRLYDHIYSAGGSHDAAEAYIAFRGRLPATQALLEKRGLVGAAAYVAT